MSLINDALKRAQRLRLEQQAAAGGTESPLGRIEKRNRPMPAQTLILLIAGSVVLVVFSVVITVYFINQEPEPKPLPPAPKPAPLAQAAAPSPVIVAPPAPSPASANNPPLAATATTTESPAVAVPPQTEAPISAAPAAPSPAPAPTDVQLKIEPQPPAPAPPKPAFDPHIQSFVDSLRVAGIRSSGAESRVILNDRVYRVNDLVDRSLGVKLVKVTSNELTFRDANGIDYVKNF